MKLTPEAIAVLQQFQAKLKALLIEYRQSLYGRVQEAYAHFLRKAVGDYIHSATNPDNYDASNTQKILPPNLIALPWDKISSVVQTRLKALKSGNKDITQWDKLNEQEQDKAVKELLPAVTEDKGTEAFHTFTTKQIESAIQALQLLLDNKEKINGFYQIPTPTNEMQVLSELGLKFKTYMDDIDGGQNTWIPPIEDQGSAQFAKEYLAFLQDFVLLVEPKNKFLEYGFMVKGFLMIVKTAFGYGVENVGPMLRQLQKNIALELRNFESLQAPTSSLYCLQIATLSSHDEFERSVYRPPTESQTKLVLSSKAKAAFQKELDLAGQGKLSESKLKKKFEKKYNSEAYDKLCVEFVILIDKFNQYCSLYAKDNSNNAKKEWKIRFLSALNKDLLQIKEVLLPSESCQRIFQKIFPSINQSVYRIVSLMLNVDNNKKEILTFVEELILNAENIRASLSKKDDYSKPAMAIGNFLADLKQVQSKTNKSNVGKVEISFHELTCALEELSLSRQLFAAYKLIYTNFRAYLGDVSNHNDVVGATGDTLNALRFDVFQLLLAIDDTTEPLSFLTTFKHQGTIESYYQEAITKSMLKAAMMALYDYFNKNKDNVAYKETLKLFEEKDLATLSYSRQGRLFTKIQGIARSVGQHTPTFQTESIPRPNIEALAIFKMISGCELEYNSLNTLHESLQSYLQDQQQAAAPTLSEK